jgi:hypothetical protein
MGSFKILVRVVAMWGAWLCLAAVNDSLGQSKGESPQPAIQRAFISFRIGVPQWMPETRFRDLLAMFDKHRGATDEITFFTSATHPPLPLEEIQKRAQVLKQRMLLARQSGYRAGINLLSTMGHHNENLANSLLGDYTRVTDIDGNTCQGSFCPNDPRVQEYARQVYLAVASAGPDCIWIDDDVRLAGHMPVFLTCFCDRCLAIFEKESGTKYTRPALKAAFVTGPPESRLALRKAWLQHNRDTIARLFAIIEQTVHGVKPGMPLGFMTGDRFYEGYDFDRWAGVLSGPGKAEVRWRPGGGFYEDDVMSGLAGKSHDVGRQVSVLPRDVVSIQSEIENFPYQRLKKSAHTTVLEAASHMAAGCTGAAFNVLSGNDEPLDEFEPLVARIRQTRPFFDLLAVHLGRRRLAGIHPAWNKDTAAACDLAGGDWFAFGRFLGEAPRLFEIGVPIDYSPQGASVTLLSDDNVVAFSKEEILRLLSGGVYMDAQALTHLNRMGYGDLTGFEVDRVLPQDCIERLARHPLNGPMAGRDRDCRQSFYHLAAFTLKKRDPKAETLSGIVDYTGGEVAPCVMGVFQNRLGGRVCVAGYFPWTFLHSLSKSAQMKAVMRWLSKDRLPAYASSFHKINLWVREPDQGAIAMALTNSCLDVARDVTLLILTDKERIRVFDMIGAESHVRASGTDGPYRRFAIPAVGPWEMRLVVAD